MFGANPKRPPKKGDGSSLEVQEIFPTIQGEGPFVGQAAVFIRLGGCNLACTFCDTEFEDFTKVALVEAIATIESLSAEKGRGVVRKLVVITGGEPLRQEIAPLCEALLAKGYQVQIETNGTLYRPLPKEVSIVCSPKVSGTMYHPIREDLLPHITAFKFLISEGMKGYQDVAELGQAAYNIPVYVQPMDEYNPELNKRNLEKAMGLVADKGHHLSIQLHKQLGIR